MKKLLIILCSIFILGSSGISYAGSMSADYLFGPVTPPGFTFTSMNDFIKFFTPGMSKLGDLYGNNGYPLPGSIQSATLSGTMKGDLFGAIFLWWSPIEIWVGGIEVFDSRNWLTINQLFSMWTYDTWINGWSYTWNFTFPDTAYGALKTDLDDGKVDFSIQGTPFFYSYRPIQFDAILSVVDPVDQPLPNNAVPEPATMLLLGSGLIGLAGYGRKKFFKK